MYRYLYMIMQIWEYPEKIVHSEISIFLHVIEIKTVLSRLTNFWLPVWYNQSFLSITFPIEKENTPQLIINQNAIKSVINEDVLLASNNTGS